MEKHTNIEQCPHNSDEQLLLENQSKSKKHETDEKLHFTLMRFLVVLVILGFLAVLVEPFIDLLGGCKVSKAREHVVLAQLANLNSIIGQYLLDMRQYPQTLEELVENKTNNPNWIGPYLKKNWLKDPWGNPFQYRYPGDRQDYDLYSYGADGQPGGEGDNADIGNWESIK